MVIIMASGTKFRSCRGRAAWLHCVVATQHMIERMSRRMRRSFKPCDNGPFVNSDRKYRSRYWRLIPILPHKPSFIGREKEVRKQSHATNSTTTHSNALPTHRRKSLQRLLIVRFRIPDESLRQSPITISLILRPTNALDHRTLVPIIVLKRSRVVDGSRRRNWRGW